VRLVSADSVILENYEAKSNPARLHIVPGAGGCHYGNGGIRFRPLVAPRHRLAQQGRGLWRLYGYDVQPGGNIALRFLFHPFVPSHGAVSRGDEFYKIFGSVSVGTVMSVAISGFVFKNNVLDLDYSQAMILYAWVLTIIRNRVCP
jgi:hypothetical protein